MTDNILLRALKLSHSNLQYCIYIYTKIIHSDANAIFMAMHLKSIFPNRLKKSHKQFSGKSFQVTITKLEIRREEWRTNLKRLSLLDSYPWNPVFGSGFLSPTPNPSPLENNINCLFRFLVRVVFYPTSLK